MKILRLCLLICIFLICKTNAQSNILEIEKYRAIKPTFEALDSAVNNPKSKYYFPDLISRFVSNDTTMTIDEMYHLYYGKVYTQSSDEVNYNWKINSIKDSIERLLSNKQIDLESHRQIVKNIQLLQKWEPLSLVNYLLPLESFKALEMNDSVKIFLKKLNMLVEAINVSGDGVTAANSIMVTDNQVIPLMLQTLGLVQKSEPSYEYDAFFVEVEDNPMGLLGLYFKELREKYESAYISPKKDKDLIEVAKAYSENKQYDKALKTLEIATQDSSIANIAYNNIAVIYEKQKRYTLAFENYNKSISLNQNYYLPWDNKSILFRFLGNLDSALYSSQRAVKLNSWDTDVQINYALVLTDLNRIIEADSIYKELYRKNPYSQYNCNNYGYTSYRLSRIEQALRLYDESIKIDPTYAKPFINKVNALIAIGKKDSALLIIDEFVKINPDNQEATIFRARLFYKDKENSKADNLLNQSNSLKPSDEESFLELAYSYLYKNDFKNSIIYIDKALAINPLFRKAMMLKANVYIITGQYKEADKALNELKTANNTEFYYYSKLLVSIMKKDKIGIKENTVQLEEFNNSLPESKSFMIKYSRSQKNMVIINILKDIVNIKNKSIRLEMFKYYMNSSNPNGDFDYKKYEKGQYNALARKLFIYNSIDDVEDSKLDEFIDLSLELYPKDTVLITLKCHVAIKNKSTIALNNYIDNSLKQNPNYFPLLVYKYLVMDYLNKQGNPKFQFNDLEQLLVVILKKAPNDLYFLEQYANLLQENQQENKANEIANRIFAIDKNNIVANTIKGRIAFNKKDNNVAIESFEKVLAVKPNDFWLSFMLHSIYMENNNFQSAKKELMRFKQLADDYGLDLNAIKSIYKDVKLLDISVLILKAPNSELEEEINNKRLFFKLYFEILKYQGAKCLMNKDSEEALNLFRELILIDESDLFYLNSLYLCYYNLKEYEESIYYLNRILEISKDDAAVEYNLACSYALLNDKTNAIKYLTMAIKHDSTFKLNSTSDPDFKNIIDSEEFKILTK